MTIKIQELPQGIVALKDSESIILNAKHLVELDELFHDQEGMPSNKSLNDFYQAQDEYYSQVH